MISPLVENARVDRSALSVVGLHENAGDVEYWLAQPVAKRFEALELLRQMAHAYDPAARLPRVLTIVERQER
jgi:hypothetical protein